MFLFSVSVCVCVYAWNTFKTAISKINTLEVKINK